MGRGDETEEQVSASSEEEPLSEEETLTNAFQKHMDSNKDDGKLKPHHDVYAYKLPSDLWFIVKYVRRDGQVEKYMWVR